MNAARLFVLALVCTLCAPSGAQTTSATPSAAPSVSMRPVSAELTDRLDSKTAKIGDQVGIKIKANVRLADGTEIPKGSKLVARVTGVQSAGNRNSNAQIALAIDHVELKHGQTLSIQGEMVAISSADSDANSTSDLMGAAPSNGSAGRAAGDMYGSTPSITAPSQIAKQSQTATRSSTANGDGDSRGTIVAHNGDLVIRSTAIPGVLLANYESAAAHSPSSSILLGAQHDIQLESGTRVMVNLESARPSSR